MIRNALKRILGGGPSLSPDLPDWQAVLRADRERWAAARAAADGPAVLIATSTGGMQPVVTVESALAVALTLRGARVHLLLCDKYLPACQLAHISKFKDADEFVAHGPRRRLCDSCYASGRSAYEPLGLPIHRYSDLLSSEEEAASREEAAAVPFAEIPDYRLDGLSVGEHVQASVLRFVTRGDLEETPRAEAITRRYLEAALLTARGMQRLFDAHGFEHACFHHGIYVPQGIIGEVARQRGAHVVNWGVGYRNRTFHFSHDRSYHHTLIDEPESNWEELPWSPEAEREIVQYLDSRAHSAKDWVKYHDRPVEEAKAIEDQVGVDFARPCALLLTNVLWDAQLHYQGNAFPDMRTWVMETIRYFRERPELQLVIRAHPGELKGTLRSRQPIADEIRAEFPTLPDNVFLIPAESEIGTHAVAELCDVALIYGTKMGVELTSRGIPVIVAGQAWLRNKGVTHDASSEDEYFRLLDRLPFSQRLAEATTRRARMYAYHFFLRRMIPWSFMEPTGSYPPFRLGASSLDDLMPGRDLGLDVVCDGILEGSEFIYPAENRHLPVTAG